MKDDEQDERGVKGNVEEILDGKDRAFVFIGNQI